MAPKLTLSQLGICFTCKDVEICTSKKTWVGPVVHCEQFDNTGAVATERAAMPLPAAAESGVSRGPEENGQSRALCVNCAAREVCAYGASNRVVWYCEEYRLAELPPLVPDSLLPPFGLKGPAATREEARGKERHAELAEADICALLEKRDARRGGLTAVLEEIQSLCGYLPETALRLVAEKTGRSMVDLYGIATFYRSFSLKPRGRHSVSVCLGTACHVRGAPMLVDEFARQLGVTPRETTPDGEFTLDTVNCLGACALGPIVVADDRYFSRVGPPKVRGILKETLSGARATDVEHDPRFFPVTVHCGRCNHSLMDPAHRIDGYPSVHLDATWSGGQGWVRLSSLYGSHAVHYERDVPVGAETDFSCPHCGEVLKGAAGCPECGCSMAPMIADGGGIVQICTLRGCNGHRLDLAFDYF